MLSYSATTAIADQRRTEREATAARARQLREAHQDGTVTGGPADRKHTSRSERGTDRRPVRTALKARFSRPCGPG
jgi:hypothetical protein